MSTASRAWHFDGNSATLALEALAAYRVGRHEHYAATLTAAHRHGQEFDVIYSWAMAVAILNNPHNPNLASDEPLHIAETFGDDEDPRQRNAKTAYGALIAAVANRHRNEAHAMWISLSEQEQADTLYMLVKNLMLALDRTSQVQ